MPLPVLDAAAREDRVRVAFRKDELDEPFANDQAEQAS